MRPKFLSDINNINVYIREHPDLNVGVISVCAFKKKKQKTKKQKLLSGDFLNVCKKPVVSLKFIFLVQSSEEKGLIYEFM